MTRKPLLFLAIVAVALNLRPALVTVGPLLPLIRSGLALSPAALGALTALPILTLAAAGSLAAPLGRRIGWSGGVIAAALLIGAGTLVRSLGGVAMLFLGTIVLSWGIGIANVYVPSLLKRGFPDAVGLTMGVYTFCLAVSATASVAVTPALLHRFSENWEPVLGVWAIPALLCAALWLPLLRPGDCGGATLKASLWRNKLAWAVTAYMGLVSTTFYGLASWYGTLLHERGLSVAATSLNLSVLYVSQPVMSLLLPAIVGRSSRQERWAIALPAIIALGIVGALYGPPAAIVFASATVGLALGGAFAIALSFMVLRARRAEAAAQLSGMAQSVGYVIAAFGPLAIGLAHATPDPLLATTVWLIALAIATMAAGALAGRDACCDDAIAAD